jgi:hypothetical protein
LQQSYQQGNTSIQLGGGPGTVTLVIKNYLKPGDSMTLVFDEGSKTIQTLQIASYLTDPKDAVTAGWCQPCSHGSDQWSEQADDSGDSEF